MPSKKITHLYFKYENMYFKYCIANGSVFCSSSSSILLKPLKFPLPSFKGRRVTFVTF